MPHRALVPKEDAEQADYVSWCRDLGLRFFRVPNETYTTSQAQKSKNRALGVSAGVQDLFVLIAPEQSVDGEGYVLCIEMKRTKYSTTSAEQYEWHEAFMGLCLGNVQPYICKGAEVAKTITRHYLSPVIAQPNPF